MYNSVISHLAGNPEFREKGTSDRLKFLFKSSYLKLFCYFKSVKLVLALYLQGKYLFFMLQRYYRLSQYLFRTILWYIMLDIAPSLIPSS